MRHEPKCLCFFQWGFCEDCVSKTLLNARYELISVASRYSCIDISITKGFVTKHRPSANIRLAGSHKSAGSSNGKKHEVVYATGSHVIMREHQHHKNKLTQGQVSYQTAATKMAVKFDLVRAEQNVKAEIDSFTHIMVAWHRFELMHTSFQAPEGRPNSSGALPVLTCQCQCRLR